MLIKFVEYVKKIYTNNYNNKVKKPIPQRNFARPLEWLRFAFVVVVVVGVCAQSEYAEFDRIFARRVEPSRGHHQLVAAGAQVDSNPIRVAFEQGACSF